MFYVVSGGNNLSIVTIVQSHLYNVKKIYLLTSIKNLKVKRVGGLGGLGAGRGGDICLFLCLFIYLFLCLFIQRFI